jgi:hypothetical protein
MGERILGPRDIQESARGPFDVPTVIETDVDFGLSGLDSFKRRSQKVFFAHSNGESDVLTIGTERVGLQKFLDEYRSETGRKIDLVATCNPHGVQLKNCSYYISGTPNILLFKENKRLVLIATINGPFSEYKILQGA